MVIRTCARSSGAFMKLLYCYQNRDEQIKRARKAGRLTVGRLGFGVPEEMILAAGMVPVMICAERTSELSRADKYLEYSFAPKAKAWFDVLAGGGKSPLPDLVAAADSEDVVNRIYYYLREISRTEPDCGIPPLHFVDLLFSRHMMYQKWNYAALERFLGQLEEWSGRRISEEYLRRGMELVESRRIALLEISALRRCAEPKISGCEALVIIGSGFFMPPEEHAALVRELADEAHGWPSLEGRRVFFCGGAQEDTAVYEKIEAAGAVVVSEDHNWGDRCYERAAAKNAEPLKAIADKYMLAGVSAQKGLVAERVEALRAGVAACSAQSVVFYTDEYEEAASWDYPSQKEMLDGEGIGSVCFCKMKYPAENNAGLDKALSDFFRGEGRINAK